MFINKRPYQINHIPNKVNYLYLKRTKNNYLLPPQNKDIEDITKINQHNIVYCEDKYFITDFSITKKETTIEEKIDIIESQPLEFFEGEDNDSLNNIYNYLYHGIRFQNRLEKLESIFKSKAILAGNYQDNYYSYSDNCNEGEYVSLLAIEHDYDIAYETFIMPNITLVVSPECNAIKTNYLAFDEWEKIHNRKTKHRYSYAHNEYQVKQLLPMEMIKAIGLPIRYLRLTNQENLIDIYINDILELMKKYNINLPIVDTSNYNKILYLPEIYKTKNKIKTKY